MCECSWYDSKQTSHYTGNNVSIGSRMHPKNDDLETRIVLKHTIQLTPLCITNCHMCVYTCVYIV